VQRQYDELTRRVTRERDATVTMCGMPPIVRFIPPPVFSDESGTDSSFHSSTWCSK